MLSNRTSSESISLLADATDSEAVDAPAPTWLDDAEELDGDKFIFSTSFASTPSCQDERRRYVCIPYIVVIRAKKLPVVCRHPIRQVEALPRVEILEAAKKGPPMVNHMRDHNPPQPNYYLGLLLLHTPL